MRQLTAAKLLHYLASPRVSLLPIGSSWFRRWGLSAKRARTCTCKPTARAEILSPRAPTRFEKALVRALQLQCLHGGRLDMTSRYRCDRGPVLPQYT